MADETRQESFGRWRHVTTAVAANAADLPDLVSPAQRLETMLNEAEGAVTEQSALAASKQQVSQRLQDFEILGRKLVTYIETGVRERYGNRSEKLTEFKIKPFRGGRRRVAKPPVPETAQAEAGADPKE